METGRGGCFTWCTDTHRVKPNEEAEEPAPNEGKGKTLGEKLLKGKEVIYLIKSLKQWVVKMVTKLGRMDEHNENLNKEKIYESTKQKSQS